MRTICETCDNCRFNNKDRKLHCSCENKFLNIALELDPAEIVKQLEEDDDLDEVMEELDNNCPDWTPIEYEDTRDLYEEMLLGNL